MGQLAAVLAACFARLPAQRACLTPGRFRLTLPRCSNLGYTYDDLEQFEALAANGSEAGVGDRVVALYPLEPIGRFACVRTSGVGGRLWLARATA